MEEVCRTIEQACTDFEVRWMCQAYYSLHACLEASFQLWKEKRCRDVRSGIYDLELGVGLQIAAS